MILYRFRTFTATYYFPKILKSKEYLYGLYSSYGGRMAAICWWLFRHCRLVRELTKIDSNDVNFEYQTIVGLAGENKIMSFNMGSPGPFQKISILGYDNVSDQPFFAKFSTKKKAIELTKNEICIYRSLSNEGLVPHILDFKQTNSYAWLMTEFVEGKRPSNFSFSEIEYELCVRLSRHHLDSAKEFELKHCLSHGDFCPWNMLEKDGIVKLIDWEQAAERPLGFDMFTYIAQVTNLVTPNTTLDMAMKNNQHFINRYFEQFGIQDWSPYLKAFAKETKAFKIMKGSLDIASRYDCLQK